VAANLLLPVEAISIIYDLTTTLAEQLAGLAQFMANPAAEEYLQDGDQ